MRLLVGLLLGLALTAQPALAEKPDREEKAAVKEEKAEAKEDKAAAVKDEKAAAKDDKVAVKGERRPQEPAGRPSSGVDLAPETTPAPSAASAPEAQPKPEPAAPAASARESAPVTAPVTAASTPVRMVSAARPRRVAPRGSRSAPAASTTPVRRPAATSTAATVATVAPSPAPTPGARSAWRRGLATEAVGVTRPPAAVGAVNRVIEVIPTPLRIALFVLLVAAAGLGLRSRWLVRQRRKLRQDIGLLQSALLPVLPHRIGMAEVSAAYRPAEGLAAGGDFYDAFALGSRRTCVLVGDVAGHDRDAVPLTADVRFTLRAYLDAGLGPRAALRAAAEVLEPRLGGRMVTVAVAVYDAATGMLTYATAGHPPPLLTGVDERLLTAGSCPPLGSGVATGLRQTSVALPPGTTACFYTDGLTDILRHGRRMGRAGLAEAVRAGGDADAVLARLVAGSDAQPDDMAACILRPVVGAAVSGGGRIEEMHVEDDPERAMTFLRACGFSDALLPPGPAVLEVRDGALSVRRAESPVLPLA